MNVYIFQAALLCEYCGLKDIEELRILGADDTGDSDDWPQGPYGSGGGEADSPQHCDHCNAFLANPLTPVGRQYVAAAHGQVAEKWRDWYGIESI